MTYSHQVNENSKRSSFPLSVNVLLLDSIHVRGWDFSSHHGEFHKWFWSSFSSLCKRVLVTGIAQWGSKHLLIDYQPENETKTFIELMFYCFSVNELYIHTLLKSTMLQNCER